MRMPVRQQSGKSAMLEYEGERVGPVCHQNPSAYYRLLKELWKSKAEWCRVKNNFHCYIGYWGLDKICWHYILLHLFRYTLHIHSFLGGRSLVLILSSSLSTESAERIEVLVYGTYNIGLENHWVCQIIQLKT